MTINISELTDGELARLLTAVISEIGRRGLLPTNIMQDELVRIANLLELKC